jgi:hypothetical protein
VPALSSQLVDVNAPGITSTSWQLVGQPYFISSAAASVAPYTFRSASIIARESTDTARF